MSRVFAPHPRPWGIRLMRGGFAAVVAIAMTTGSILLVTSLNAAPSAPTPEAAPRPTVMVPIAPAPEPEPTDPAPSDPTAETADAPADAAAAIAPPAPAPIGLGDLAPTAGPGTLALGMGGQGLPSVSSLPDVDLGALPTGEPDTPARPSHRPPPRYPPVAQRRGIEGAVTVRLRVDARGRVVDAVVVASDPPGIFDRTALQTARRYRFTPARAQGKPVATTLQQTIRFRLK